MHRHPTSPPSSRGTADEAAPPTRRAWLRSALAWPAATLLAGALTMTLPGCGFKLRGTQHMAFQTIQLTGFAGNSPLAAELARALENSGVQVVDSTLAAAQAASSSTVPTSHVVLDGLQDTRDVTVASTTAYGQVRDLTARTTLRFRVLRSDGSVLLPANDIVQARDLPFNEKDALAKQDETDDLHRAMQSDIVSQVLRRLAAIRPERLQAP